MGLCSVVYTAAYTVYSVQCSMYSTHCTLYTVYSVQCSMYSTHCTLYTEYSVQCLNSISLLGGEPLLPVTHSHVVTGWAGHVTVEAQQENILQKIYERLYSRTSSN